MRLSNLNLSRLLIHLLPILSVTVIPSVAAADDKSISKKPEEPCTARSSSTGSFFDISPINLQAKPSSKKSKTNGDSNSNKSDEKKAESWHARGYDYGSNFTLNFCGPVLEELSDVKDIKESLWRNVSAYYKKDGDVFSIGYVCSRIISPLLPACATLGVCRTRL